MAEKNGIMSEQNCALNKLVEVCVRQTEISHKVCSFLTTNLTNKKTYIPHTDMAKASIMSLMKSNIT